MVNVRRIMLAESEIRHWAESHSMNAYCKGLSIGIHGSLS